MGELELEPDAELPEERLVGCTSAMKSRGGSPCSGSLMCRSSVMGESMIPHVRIWERLQSSHVHLKLDQRHFRFGKGPHLWIINVFKNYSPKSHSDGNKPSSIIAVWTVWNAQA